MKDKIVIIRRGKKDWSADGITEHGTYSSSGAALDFYLAQAEDGTLVYDAINADYNSFAKMVYQGPMIKLDLPAGTTDSFKYSNVMKQMLPSLGGSFKSIALLSLANFSSLDFVAPDVYLELLRKNVSGVKFGKVINHQIIWTKSITND